MTHFDSLVEQAIDLLKQANHAVALTGAGISTPSGIPDFRSESSGLWEQVDPMEVASIYAFKQQPQKFYDWMRPLTELMLQAKPNAAHMSLVDLETHGPLKCIITQNIDRLHTKAGSHIVHEVHGHLRQATCLSCYTIYDAEPILIKFVATGEIPHCPDCNGILKPNVILFGELLPVSVLNAAKQQTMACDLMLVAGSSLEVAPVGDLPWLAKQVDARLIIVNLSKTHLDHLADVVIHADVVDVLPKLAASFVSV